MHRSAVERAIWDTHSSLIKARQDLAVLDEQCQVMFDAADEARVRSLVSETPIATAELADAERHAQAFARERDAVRARVAELERRRDELLSQLSPR